MFCKLIFHFSFTPGGYLSVDGMCSGWAGRLVMGLTDVFFFFFSKAMRLFSLLSLTHFVQSFSFLLFDPLKKTHQKKKKKKTDFTGWRRHVFSLENFVYRCWRNIYILLLYCLLYGYGCSAMHALEATRATAAHMDSGYLCGNEFVSCIKGKVAKSHV